MVKITINYLRKVKIMQVLCKENWSLYRFTNDNSDLNNNGPVEVEKINKTAEK